MYTFETKSVLDSIATIVCTPKPDAAIVWGKVVYKADISKNIPILVEYYDEDGELVRTMEFDQVEYISGRWIPLRMSVHPIDKPNEVTEIIYDNLEFDVILPANLFSVTSLRRR